MHGFLSIHFSASDAKFKTHIIRPSVCPENPFLVKISDIFPTFHLRSFFVTGLLLRCILFRTFFFLFFPSLKRLEFCMCVQTYFTKSFFCCSAKPKVCISFVFLSNIAAIMKASTILTIYFSSSLCLVGRVA